MKLWLMVVGCVLCISTNAFCVSAGMEEVGNIDDKVREILAVQSKAIQEHKSSREILDYVVLTEKYRSKALAVSCSLLTDSSNLINFCYTLQLWISEHTAQMKLNTAKYAAQQGDKITAKQQYRDIIVTFTGPAYASYVKQAEFGLEDLKDMK